MCCDDESAYDDDYHHEGAPLLPIPPRQTLTAKDRRLSQEEYNQQHPSLELEKGEYPTCIDFCIACQIM